MRAVIDANNFKRIIDNTKRFIGYSKLMEYIYLEVDADEKIIRATALDGNRISVEYSQIKEADHSFCCYIKPMLPKITRSTEYVTLEFTGDRLLVNADGCITGFVQPEGKYYPVQELIEKELRKEPISTIGINAGYLKDALASVNTGIDTKKVIELDVKNPEDAVIIKTKSHNGLPKNIKLILPVRINGK